MDRTRPEFIERFPEAPGTGVFYVPIFRTNRDAFRALALDFVSHTSERRLGSRETGPVSQYMVQVLASPEAPCEKHFLHPLSYSESYELGQQADEFLWVPDALHSFRSMISVECPGFACGDADSEWACRQINPCSCNFNVCQ